MSVITHKCPSSRTLPWTMYIPLEMILFSDCMLATQISLWPLQCMDTRDGTAISLLKCKRLLPSTTILTSPRTWYPDTIILDKEWGFSL